MHEGWEVICDTKWHNGLVVPHTGDTRLIYRFTIQRTLTDR